MYVTARYLLLTTLVLGVAAPLRGQQDPFGPPEALHLLNRAAYGPRPGDVARVVEMGLAAYLDEQLRPERIDDADTQSYLDGLPVLRLSAGELRDIYFEQLRARRARRQGAARDSGASPAPARRPDQVRRHLADFQQATIARAVLSERQLLEVMVDFWTNHFNVFMYKGFNRFLLPSYIEETIRPNALGRFGDLLSAVARSPAMLFYLDNAQSVAPGTEPPQLQRMRQRASALRGGQMPGRERIDSAIAQLERRAPRGINENYARELLELHTLGVDGGFAQADVVDVARILTGWSLRQRPGEVAFVFNAWAHDHGAKVVLGETFAPGGEQDEGERLLRLLARHPSTVRFVSGKLCRRFVSDGPSAECVDAAVRAWEDSDGHIPSVVRAILLSPAFWAAEHRGAKIKTPLEFVASAVRAMGLRPDLTPGLARLVGRLGQPLFEQSAPTGYPERQESWVNSGALLARMNVSLALAAGRAPGVHIDGAPAVLPTTSPDELVATIDRLLLHGSASPGTLEAIRRQVSAIPDPAAARSVALGLAIGSPAFQRQ